MKRLRYVILALIVLAAIVLAGFLAASKLYIDVLWFKSLGYASLFWKPIIAKWSLAGLGFAFAAIFLGAFWGSVRAESEAIPTKVLKPIGVIIVSFLMANWLKDNWYDFMLFTNHTSFGVADPIFGRDVSWYVFTYPIYNLLSSWLMALIVFTIAGCILLSQIDWRKEFPVGRLSILASALLLLGISKIILSTFGLVYSPRGAAFGASYTDVHAQIPANYAYIAVLVLLAVYLVINAFRKNLKAVVMSVVGAIALWVVMVGIYPSVYQRLIVKPNELAKETPFIRHNIEMTKKGYGLDDVTERPFTARDLTPEDLEENQETLDSIRLIDWRPVKAVYQQLQELRPYYSFYDLDVDRYNIDGRDRQVVISVRELDSGKLPEQAKTWINERLKYTHGYGFVMSPVNEITPEGQPTFLVKDFPPKGMKVTQPRIYVGELSNDHVFVDTSTTEFDYPSGDTNKYYRYTGKDGIRIGRGFRKLAFAWNYGFSKILLSSYITPDSRILLHRRVLERINKLMPFIEWDDNTYPVFENGRIYWIIEGFTSSSRYPYSEPFSYQANGGSNLNYIRNSVKAVVDAYDGTVDFYMDSKEPIIASFAKSFPVFKDFSEMPKELHKHLKYSETLFNVQSIMYRVYHMTNPQVFFNKEDQWNIPQEVYEQSGTQQTTMDPYYVMSKLKGSEKPEFVLMRPFTPISKENMIAWLAGRSNEANYGKLVLYKFSKESLIYGPMQVQAKVDQDTELSKSLSLWNQQGSQVIRGNTLAYPINNSIMYVQPIYLQAEQGKIPELKKIVTFANGRLGIGDNFEQALSNLFQGMPIKDIIEQRPSLSGTATETSAAVLNQLIDQALNRLDKAQQAAGSGQWAQFGSELDQLAAELRELRTMPKGSMEQ